ncbi:MAG: hypothetical protein EHM65_01190 [Acidobacteriales bacterium]|nr:MAG: hypothetical protein EHM65_01190 [Terriglobales bacterium]
MQSSHARTLAALLAAQNSDGGWGYGGGGSWTEPTACALLALTGEEPAADALRRGAHWLTALQRPDGGWPPRASVVESTWVTAAALLALAGQLPRESLARSVRWLLAKRGEESGLWRRVRLKLLGVRSDVDTGVDGWPWFPDTAAWVAPTAVTLLALEKAGRRDASAELRRRLDSGRQFLWSRICHDGGWNHGSTRALGYQAESYPETTGLALLALHGAESPKLPLALAAAERHLRACRSSEGISWLRLGLLAHSSPAARVSSPQEPGRGVMDCALFLLAEKAAAGTNRFLD